MTEQTELRALVRGVYDLQALRIQSGLRLVANFRAKLNLPELPKGEEPPEAKALIAELKEHYRRLTDGIAKNRTRPSKAGFKGDEIISTYTELALIGSYDSLCKEEDKEFAFLGEILGDVPIYRDYLSRQGGIGPAMGGVICTGFDPRKARYPSSFSKYCGIDVGPDGRGRSTRQEHLIEREYVDKKGQTKTKMSVTFDPWLKAKMIGVLGPSFLRVRDADHRWKAEYYNYKHRIESDPSRVKISSEAWKRKNEAKEDVRDLYTPKRIHNMAIRYMMKQFLIDLWLNWRRMEGLPVVDPYPVAKLGMRRHGEGAGDGGGSGSRDEYGDWHEDAA